MYRKHPTKGRPIVYKTWLSLWLDARQVTAEGFARAVCYSLMSVHRWRRGGPMGEHAAQLIRARWEDAPINRRGGRVIPISAPLPINARTPLLYRFLMKKAGIIGEAKIAPIALAQARGLGFGSKAKEVPIPGGEVDPNGV